MLAHIFLMNNLLLFRNTSSSCGISFILVLNYAHSAEFESHLPTAVKALAMDFKFDVVHNTDLLKSQIYLYAHPTYIETILNFHFEEILCVTLAMQ